MNELHKKSKRSNTLLHTEGEFDLLPVATEPTHCRQEVTGVIFTRDNLEALAELGDILRPIKERMLAEGFEIIHGQVQKKYA
ncbi:MAG: hypothetical protein RL641_35 [Candidatus Parcubacteria bacterium]|jgi:hypothetical protein